MKTIDFARRHQLDYLLNLKEEQNSQAILVLGTFAELSDMITNPDGRVRVQVRWTPQASATTALPPALVCRLRIETCLRIECQRCLEPMDLPVVQSTLWVLTESGTPAPAIDFADDEQVEYLAYSDYAGIVDLISQELILAIPMVARHDPEDCPAKDILEAAHPDAAEYGNQNRSSVFDVLKKLRNL